MKNLIDIKNDLNNNDKDQLISNLILMNIKGGRNCPPPWEVD